MDSKKDKVFIKRWYFDNDGNAHMLYKLDGKVYNDCKDDLVTMADYLVSDNGTDVMIDRFTLASLLRTVANTKA